MEPETLRRDLATVQSHLRSDAHSEREALATRDAEALREEVARGEAERTRAAARLTDAEAALEAAGAARRGGARAERAADEESETNRRWREASTELEQLRLNYEEDDAAHGVSNAGSATPSASSARATTTIRRRR